MSYKIEEIAPNTELNRIDISGNRQVIVNSPNHQVWMVVDENGVYVREQRSGKHNFEMYSSKSLAQKVADKYNEGI